ncbi:MAG TPA: HAMP domain-containing sensor histidine kinase [Candidatus Limnocylindria bacterium]|nr:HAMP domain-containing sensor histidine kinase [Candidatus Limnocylindria bacterium]
MTRSIRAAGAVTRRFDPRIALAAAAVALAAAPLEVAAGLREPASLSWLPISVPIGLFAIIALARPFEPAPGEKFSLGAAVAFFAAQVLPAADAVAVIAAAALMTRLYQGRSAISTIVNVSSLAGATAAAALVVSIAALPRIAVTTLSGAAFWAFTLATIGLMVGASGGPAAALAFLRREAVPTATLICLGAIGGILWQRDVLAILLLVIPLVAVEAGLRHAARERAALAALREAHEAQRRFAEDAAHELRTPLTALIGDLAFVDRAHLAPAEAAAIGDAQRTADALRGLTDRLLSLARSGVPSGGAQGDLADVTRDVVGRATPRPDVALRLDSAEHVAVRMSSELLAVVVGDLLANAIAYTERGAIDVKVEARAGAAWLTVWDTGVGIPGEDLDRVFDRFVRGSNARTLAPGSGLGLAIVKRVVDAHGGSIRVTSAVGRGTLVEVQLPLVTAGIVPAAVPERS